jgi:sec-independent protein translocase protein TatB
LSSVGLSELFLLFVIGLLILGPERLPRVASQIGRWVGRARRTANQLRYQLEREIAEAEREQTPKPKPKPALPDQAATDRIAGQQASARSGDDSGTGPAPGVAAETAPEPAAEVTPERAAVAAPESVTTAGE